MPFKHDGLSLILNAHMHKAMPDFGPYNPNTGESEIYKTLTGPPQSDQCVGHLLSERRPLHNDKGPVLYSDSVLFLT